MQLHHRFIQTAKKFGKKIAVFCKKVQEDQ